LDLYNTPNCDESKNQFKDDKRENYPKTGFLKWEEKVLEQNNNLNRDFEANGES